MLATFTIELAFAIYVLWRYTLNNISKLTVLILVCLSIFQITEYLLCGMSGISGGVWSRIGYSAITMLPPLGIHLGLTIAGKTKEWTAIVRLVYATAFAFIAYFAFYTPAITGQTCYANYVVFEGRGDHLASWLYGAYYYGWLAIGVFFSWYYGMKAKLANVRRALYALAVGYLVFIIPTTAVNLADPSTVSGIPSIMCGFAVLLAFMLVGKVLPEAAAKTK